MSDHYYSRDPKSESDVREIRAEIRGRTLTFATDSSVFAKRGIDYGTRALIERLPLPLNGTVLDVGCGYGVIGLTVASFSPETNVTMVDVNRRALELCRSNAERNRLGDRVDILESDGLSALAERDFDWILTNPPIRAGKSVVHRIFEEASCHLRENGQFWLVIQKKQGAPSAVKKLKTLFSAVDIVARDKGYAVIQCRK